MLWSIGIESTTQETLMGHCFNTTVIDTSTDQAWATVRDFHSLEWAAPVVTSVEKVGEAGATEIGAKRVLNGAFHETLLELDDAAHTLTYSIDDGPGPVASDVVANYRGVVRLFPVTDSGQTFVIWQSSYDSDDDAAVGEFCDPIYQGLLAALKARFA
jgi:hypothetical protein